MQDRIDPARVCRSFSENDQAIILANSISAMLSLAVLGSSIAT